MDFNIVAQFADDITHGDVLTELLSSMSLSSILQLSLTTKTMYARVRRAISSDFFWKKWVLNTLFPHHDPSLIANAAVDNPWRWYARLHGRFEGRELYQGIKREIDRWLPLYSSSVPLTVARHYNEKYIAVLRGGILGFVRRTRILSGGWKSYPSHNLKKDSYVDFFVLSHAGREIIRYSEYTMEICLLTKLGRVYRITIPYNSALADAKAVADIWGLGNRPEIVQISPTRFLSRNGKIYYYSNNKIFEQPSDISIAWINHEGFPNSDISFPTQRNVLPPIRLLRRLRKYTLSVSDWKTANAANVAISYFSTQPDKDIILDIGAPARGYFGWAFVSWNDEVALWTTSGELYVVVYWPSSGSHSLIQAKNIPDFVVSAEGTGMGLIVVALPRQRDEALRQRLLELDSDQLRALLLARMADKPFDEHYTLDFLLRESVRNVKAPDDDATIEFLLREPAQDVQLLVENAENLLQDIVKLRKEKRANLNGMANVGHETDYSIHIKDLLAARIALIKQGYQ